MTTLTKTTKIYRLRLLLNAIEVTEQELVSIGKTTITLRRDPKYGNRRINIDILNTLQFSSLVYGDEVCAIICYCTEDKLQECIDQIPAKISSWIVGLEARIARFNTILDTHKNMVETTLPHINRKWNDDI